MSSAPLFPGQLQRWTVLGSPLPGETGLQLADRCRAWLTDLGLSPESAVDVPRYSTTRTQWPNVVARRESLGVVPTVQSPAIWLGVLFPYLGNLRAVPWPATDIVGAAWVLDSVSAPASLPQMGADPDVAPYHWGLATTLLVAGVGFALLKGKAW